VSTEFQLPDVGEGLEEAEIVEWLVAVGDTVVRDQPLVEILTDKSQTQLPAPVGGTVKMLAFSVGDVATVGDILVVIDGGDDVVPAATPEASTKPEAITQVPPAVDTPPPAARRAPDRRPKASPVVRKEALVRGIDLAAVTGTGPGGRILAADLDITSLPAAATPMATKRAPLPVAATETSLGQMPAGRHPLRGIRRVTAEAMNRSWTIPHIHGQDEIDASPLLAARAAIKSMHPQRAGQLTPVAFFVMAVARALRQFPLVNSSIDMDAGEIIIHEDVNVGIAVATEAGLMVPVIRNADRRDLFDIAAEIAVLSGAARGRTITTDQLRGGTCTISNYGSLGGRFSNPIIKSPEAAIVGFGSIRQRPFVVDGVVAAVPTLPVVTAADHRLIDGDLMTAFQENVMALLSNPIALTV
jgi:pyruvate dehydrogenase E2 component (dihydrolipoamide acetyltransferase)